MAYAVLNIFINKCITLAKLCRLLTKYTYSALYSQINMLQCAT